MIPGGSSVYSLLLNIGVLLAATKISDGNRSLLAFTVASGRLFPLLVMQEFSPLMQTTG
jgi:hypothetical protein